MTQAFKARRLALIPGDRPHDFDELIDALATLLERFDACRRMDLRGEDDPSIERPSLDMVPLAAGEFVALKVGDVVTLPADLVPAFHVKRAQRQVSEATRAKMRASQARRNAREGRGKGKS